MWQYLTGDRSPNTATIVFIIVPIVQFGDTALEGRSPTHCLISSPSHCFDIKTVCGFDMLWALDIHEIKIKVLSGGN